MLPIGNMDISSPAQLGATVRAERKRLRVTQKDLAMASGTGLRFIVDLEKGKPTCHIGKIVQVLRALGVQIRVDKPDAGAGK
jgi:y4mF family transcriptional regulator